MGKMFLYGRTVEQHNTDRFSKLTVRCPIEAVVRAKSVDSSVMYDAKTDVNGEVIFNRMTPGYWDVAMVDVDNTPVKRIKVDSLDYELNLNDFVSTINITYPANSVCTLTYDNKTYVAPDTSGNWICTVYNAGEWTASCTNGGQTASTTISVVSYGQNMSVTLEYFEASINITYTEGCVCTCSYGNKTYTSPDTSGNWICSIPNPGTWLITVTGNGGSKSNTVTITEDGQVVNNRIMIFEAYISVVYPEGSTCICYSNTDGPYYASDTSGRCVFAVSHAGAWTVECRDDSDNVENYVVQITEDGQQENVELSYTLYLYDSGNECESLTGGWQAVTTRSTSSGNSKAPTLTTSSTLSISLSTSYQTYRGSVTPKNNSFNLTAYSRLVVETTGSTTGLISVVLTTSNTDGYDNNRLAYLDLQNTNTGSHVLDISSINRNCYLFISVGVNSSNKNASTKILKIYLD